MGIRTNFSYIVGLESLGTIEKGFSEFLPYVNSFPIVNVFRPIGVRRFLGIKRLIILSIILKRGEL